ncbi:hypothetical protein [Geminocystis herdmanii]|uniref:hypothetical protein n=1 Tax=Geminocystis herdmanii TaxID=669359 RepID=UPI00034DAE96|nr:hypothetical protein [Geminocystis herdmanii]
MLTGINNNRKNITDWRLEKFREAYNVKQPSRLSDRQDACFTEGKDIEKIDIL